MKSEKRPETKSNSPNEQRLILSPWQLFLFAAIISLVFAFFSNKNTIDIHLHDTYYVIRSSHVRFALCCYFLFIWLLYFFSKKFLWSNKLTWLHIIFTFAGLLVLKSAYLFFDNNKTSFAKFQIQGSLISMALLVFVIAQLLFILNILGGIIQKKQYPI